MLTGRSFKYFKFGALSRISVTFTSCRAVTGVIIEYFIIEIFVIKSKYFDFETAPASFPEADL